MRARNTTSLFFGFRNKTADDRAHFRVRELEEIRNRSGRSNFIARSSEQPSIDELSDDPALAHFGVVLHGGRHIAPPRPRARWRLVRRWVSRPARCARPRRTCVRRPRWCQEASRGKRDLWVRRSALARPSPLWQSDPVSPARSRLGSRPPLAAPTRGPARSFADARVCFSHPSPRTDENSTGGGGPGVTHEGLTLHEPGMFHKGWAYGLGGLTWFWIFYRFYKDGDTLIYGHAPHFEHDDDDHH